MDSLVKPILEIKWCVNEIFFWNLSYSMVCFCLTCYHFILLIGSRQLFLGPTMNILGKNNLRTWLETLKVFIDNKYWDRQFKKKMLYNNFTLFWLVGIYNLISHHKLCVKSDKLKNIAKNAIKVKRCIHFGVTKLCIREFRLEKFGLFHITGKL